MGEHQRLAVNGAIQLTRRELHALDNYSCSLPTGTTAGKRWRRAVDYYRQDDNDAWYLGEYGQPFPTGHEHEGQIPISWTPILVVGVARKWPTIMPVPQRPLQAMS
jgi:hypothetical protein